MVGSILGLILVLALWLLCLGALHRALRDGQIGFRPWQAAPFNPPRNIFTRKDKPGLYWLFVGVLLIGAVLIPLVTVRKFW